MKYNRMTRRHFLQGSGSSMLALPFLPSLMSTAEAQALPNSKCLVMFWSGHGGINHQNMYPIDTNPAISSQITTTSIYPSQGHNYRSGSLLNMKTTRSSNLPYLSSVLGNEIGDPLGAMPGANTYGINRSGVDFDNGQARLTPIVGSFVSDAHIAKMNLVAGLDMIHDSGHGNQHTGNFCNYSGNDVTTPGQTKAGMPNIWVPTIDSVIARASQFYGSSSPIARSMVLNGYWSGASDFNEYMSCDRSGSTIVPNSNVPRSVGEAFNILFASLKANSNSSVLDKKNFILNNIYQDYKRLSRGAFGPGRRIGQEDRNRLEEFMSNLNGILQGVISGSGASCVIPPISASDKSSIADGYYGLTSTLVNYSTDAALEPATLGLYNQIIAASFACGVCKIFLVGVPGLKDRFVPEGSPGATFSDGLDNTDAHQGMHHHHGVADRQQMLVESQRFYFQNMFYDLMKKLDATPTSSGSVLDQSLMFWTHESGFNTHLGQSLPMIMAGGAGGFLKTGRFIDYRNPTRAIYQYQQKQYYQGLPYNRFLATALQSMGLAPSDYELTASTYAGTTGRIPTTSSGTIPGYGHPYQTPYALNNGQASKTFIYDYMLNDMSQPLPGLT